MTGYALGVDLGTSYTAAAVSRDGRLEMVTLGNRALEIPSVGYLARDGSVDVGEAAERRGIAEPGRVVRDFKRRIGDPTPIIVGGSPFAPEALMAAVLEWVLHTVTEREGGPPDSVVLTCPANWGAYKHELLDQVAALAGLSDFSVATEPEAAAVHFASTTRVQVGDLVAVYDLGGGTFDAAILRKTPNGFELLGRPEGIEHLGGADFDDAIVAHVRESVSAAVDLDHEDGTEAGRSVAARFRQECVQAKENLSYDHEVTIPVLVPGMHTEVRLVRAEFEDVIRPAIDATLRALRRAIRSAGVEPGDVAAVLLAGGSSRIPLVAERLVDDLGIPVALSGHPKHSVALGAAYLAAAGTRGQVTAPVPGPAVPQGPGGEPRRVARTGGEPRRPAGMVDDSARGVDSAPGSTARRRGIRVSRGLLVAGGVAAVVVLAATAAVVVRSGGGTAVAGAAVGSTEVGDPAVSTTRDTVGTAGATGSADTGTGDTGPSESRSPNDGGAASAAAAPDPDQWCRTLTEAFGDIHGRKVELLAAVTDAAALATAYQPWEACTGARITVRNLPTPAQVTAEAARRLAAGNPPDLVDTEHLGALDGWVRSGAGVRPLPAVAQQNLQAFYDPAVRDLVSAGDTAYAVPDSVSVKSLVWFSPKRFAAHGYQIPQTVDELSALTDRIVADGGTPWCAGIRDPAATGWVLTDWLEDIVLRASGSEAYDRWVTHDIAFSDPPVADALARLGTLIKDDRYLAGGVAGAASTAWSADGTRLAHGDCELVRQAGFLGQATSWPGGTEVGPGKDVYAFYLPAAAGASERPVLVGGDAVVRLTDRPESASAQTYLTFPSYADIRGKSGEFLSLNSKADAGALTDPIRRLESAILRDPRAVIRFDASDLMPSAVGSDAEWSQLTRWLRGEQDDTTTLAAIDRAWPS